MESLWKEDRLKSWSSSKWIDNKSGLQCAWSQSLTCNMDDGWNHEQYGLWKTYLALDMTFHGKKILNFSSND